MVFGVDRGVTYIVDWKCLTILHSDLFSTLILRWSGKIVQVGVRWSEVPELANHGSWLLVIAALDAVAIAVSLVGGVLP